MTLPLTQRKKKSPERLHLHHCFNLWARHPEIESRYGDLIAAMNEHELNVRLRRLLPFPEAPISDSDADADSHADASADADPTSL